MIILLTTRTHNRTHFLVKKSRMFDFRMMSYERLFTRWRVPQATYIFGDLDRLHPWDLECAARIHQQLQAAGMRVLNDPAGFRDRITLLRKLFQAGINPFNAWHVDDEPPADAYPVFLRTNSAHRGSLTDLLHSPVALEQAIEQALEAGVPRRELIIIQYAAQADQNGLFRKLAHYRVGDRIVPGLCLYQPHWEAKLGKNITVPLDVHEEEHEIIATSRYAGDMAPAFDLAGISYGRMDFGLVDARPCIYEINTNPHIKEILEHAYPIREQNYQMVREGLFDAIKAIDTPSTPGRIPLRDPRSVRTQLGDWYRTGRWRRIPQFK